jgi:hypothetical protein
LALRRRPRRQAGDAHPPDPHPLLRLGQPRPVRHASVAAGTALRAPSGSPSWLARRRLGRSAS